MPPLVVRGGRTLYVVDPAGGPLGAIALGSDIDEFARRWAGERASLVGAKTSALEERYSGLVWADESIGPARASSAGRAGPVRLLREARARIPWASLAADERPLLLAVAREALRAALASPEQTVIALAREEERVGRALRREREAGAQILAGDAGELALYVQERTEWEHRFEGEHRALLNHLRVATRRLAPNLSTLLGELVAARLIAAAGSLSTLGRMSAARLQLLGARRRPGPGRDGPRFGLLFTAVVTAGVPAGREGAFARSLSALAVIAARADAITRRDLGTMLSSRRDRRVRQLRKEPR